MRKIIVLIVIIVNCYAVGPAVDKATIRVEKKSLFTYMFSEPDPVPKTGRVYPYFRFEGYTNRGEFKDWNMVILENDYIKVYVCPEIGGKIWGAVEKSTGKEFLYFNKTVKFRDIGMRGAWTSGGLEYNFGDIGHIPTCATPVDYSTSKNFNGSVSCSVGAIDLPSGTKWNVKIIVPAEGAYFKTVTSWFNNTSLPVTYYHWMNAAASAEGDLEFIYPGNKWIGHDGEYGDWPNDKGRNISFYKNNNFGNYKSYHVINSFSSFMGGYWHEFDFGFGHISDYDEKPGKKIWIWGLSDQGMIWEKLLTDTDGQYVEYQSGKLFNQASAGSTFSPFKHREFLPHDTDIMRELWFPLKGTKGMIAASDHAVLNCKKKGEKVTLFLSALKKIDADLVVMSGKKILLKEKIKCLPLELTKRSFSLGAKEDFEVRLGKDLLHYSSLTKDRVVNRPLKEFEPFCWNSPYGLYTKGLELEKQRDYTGAEEHYRKSLEKENTFLPSINRMALSYYRKMEYKTALEYTLRSLSVNTYNPMGNYIYGLTNSKLKKNMAAKNGFSIASQSVSFRSAAYTETAKIYMREGRLNTAEKYADKALRFNSMNIKALEILAVICRKENRKARAEKILEKISALDQTSIFTFSEKILLKTTIKGGIEDRIYNELPHESFIELADSYLDLGCEKEALRVLSSSPENPIVCLWMSYLNHGKGKQHLEKMLTLSPELVFPHRIRSAEILEHFVRKIDHWKLKYYLGLIYWNKGLYKKAQKLFFLCGDKPDYYPFYLAKIKLFKKDEDIRGKSLKKACQISPSSIRVVLEQIKYLYDRGRLKDAEIVAEKNIKLFPERAQLGLLYGKVLLALGKYERCINFLDGYTVLPYEGATEGRTIFHTACVKAAFGELKRENYKDALTFAVKGKTWPLNLGVGKSYYVNERLDDFIIGYCYEQLGEKKDSEKYYMKAIGQKNSVCPEKELFQLKETYKKNGKIELINDLIVIIHNLEKEKNEKNCSH